jgi:uncharacterized protein
VTSPGATVEVVIAAAPEDAFPSGSTRRVRPRRRGVLLMLGMFGDPQREGSMSIFTTREAAEEFVAGDRFMLEGVIRSWQIREWSAALSQLTPADPLAGAAGPGGAAARIRRV